MARLAQPTILRTKAELDAALERQRQWQASLNMLRGYGRHWRDVDDLPRWKDKYARGDIDFATFEGGLAERLQ